MSYGVTTEGFVRKRLADIKLEIEASLRSLLGESINLLAPSVFSQLVGIQAEREALIWELAEDTYNAGFPGTAEGVSLDNVAAFTGVVRLAATFSTGSVYLFGTATTLVPAGTVLSVDGNENAQFETDAAVTLVAGQDEVQDISFSATPLSGNFKLSYVGEETADIPYTANAAAVQAALRLVPRLEEVTVSGSFAAGFDVTFTGTSGLRPQPLLEIVDNTLLNGGAVVVTVTETTPGVAQGTATVTALVAGAVQAPAGTLTEIDTPVSGLDSVVNFEDILVGREEETDLELRDRRDESAQISGSATVEAIRARLRNVEGVANVQVIENDTDSVDGDGRPPHSVEAIVQGGDDQDIADELWDAKGGGIKTFGNTTVQIVDSMGFEHDMNFSRPVAVPIYIELNVTTDDDFPVDGEAQIKLALVTRGNASFTIGKDVIVIPTLIGVLDEIAGITDVEIFVGLAPNPVSSDNLPMGVGELPTFDTTRVVVNFVP